MLDLDGYVISQTGKLAMKISYQRNGVTYGIEEIRIPESDVLRASLHLLANIRENDFLLYDPKLSSIDGDDWAMLAEVLASAAGFSVPDHSVRTVRTRQLGIVLQFRKRMSIRDYELLSLSGNDEIRLSTPTIELSAISPQLLN